MKITQLLICLLFVAFMSCKSDNGATTENTDSTELESSPEEINSTSGGAEEAPKMDEKIDENALQSKIIEAAEKKEVDEVAKVEATTVTKLVGKSKAELEKEAELKKESTKKAIAKSENKGMSCDQILKDQTKLVNDYMSSKSIDVLRKLMAKQNDPFFQECMKSNEFSNAIEALEEKMSEM